MIIDLLQRRVSARKFQNKPVPEEVIRDMLEAGRLSPSGGNEQPWMFGVITDPGSIKDIAKLAQEQQWIAGAPLLIVLCTVCVEDAKSGRDIQLQRYPKYARAIASISQQLYWALNQEEHQTKIAGAHIALAALEHGVSTCWVSRFDVEELAQFLNLPPNILPSEILVCGYPESQPAPRDKKSLDALVFRNRFKG